jgi:hypothetical protein
LDSVYALQPSDLAPEALELLRQFDRLIHEPRRDPRSVGRTLGFHPSLRLRDEK